jgi:xylulokinase
MSNNDKYGYIGIDLGTTNLKAGLFSLKGELYTESERAFSIERPQAGIAEQDPLCWDKALHEVLYEMLEKFPEMRVQGIGVCSQVSSHVFIDSNGNPLIKVVLWQDQRTADYVEVLNSNIRKISTLFPDKYSVDATSSLARAKWASVENPELWKKTRYILNPKDYINYQLTGCFAGDPLSAYDSVDDKGRYIQALDQIVPGIINALPELHDFREPLGTYKKRGDEFLDSALQDAVVAIGTMDVFGNLFGSGASKSGDAIEVCGTCEIMGTWSEKESKVKGVVSFPKVDNLFLYAGPTKSGGASTQWFAGILNKSLKEFDELAEQVQAGCDGLVFLPYIEGERAPIWDTNARGVFFGISGEHSTRHFCRAVLEGVAFSARHLMEEIDTAAGFRAKRIRISGGGSKSDINCQIRADILNRTIERIQIKNSGLIGAVAFAAVASGNFDDLSKAGQALIHVEKSFTPDPRNREKYDNLYKIYRSLYVSLASEYKEMAEFRKLNNYRNQEVTLEQI